MTEYNYKVGDRVRLAENIHPHKAGDRGVLIERPSNSSWEFRIQMDSGEQFPLDACEIELTDAAVVTASDPVSHPSHYQHPSGIEVIEITKHESFLRGNIVKYVLRAPFKGSELQDLKKAQQYLTWEIERVESQGD